MKNLDYNTVSDKDKASFKLIVENLMEWADPEDYIQSLDAMFDHWLIYQEIHNNPKLRERLLLHYRNMREMLQGLDKIFPSNNEN